MLNFWCSINGTEWSLAREDWQMVEMEQVSRSYICRSRCLACSRLKAAALEFFVGALGNPAGRRDIWDQPFRKTWSSSRGACLWQVFRRSQAFRDLERGESAKFAPVQKYFSPIWDGLQVWSGAVRESRPRTSAKLPTALYGCNMLTSGFFYHPVLIIGLITC